MAVFRMFRGNTFPITVQVTRGNPAVPVDITGWTIWFTLKRSTADPDPGVFQGSTLTSGVVITDAQNGKIACTMPASATSSFEDAIVPLVYDVKGKDTFGNESTIDFGDVYVQPGVTQAS